MNPVGLILNIFLCCIVNIHVLYEYEIDLIATDNLLLGTRRVSVISIGRV